MTTEAMNVQYLSPPNESYGPAFTARELARMLATYPSTRPPLPLQSHAKAGPSPAELPGPVGKRPLSPKPLLAFDKSAGRLRQKNKRLLEFK